MSACFTNDGEVCEEKVERERLRFARFAFSCICLCARTDALANAFQDHYAVLFELRLGILHRNQKLRVVEQGRVELKDVAILFSPIERATAARNDQWLALLASRRNLG